MDFVKNESTRCFCGSCLYKRYNCGATKKVENSVEKVEKSKKTLENTTFSSGKLRGKSEQFIRFVESPLLSC